MLYYPGINLRQSVVLQQNFPGTASNSLVIVVKTYDKINKKSEKISMCVYPEDVIISKNIFSTSARDN